VASAESAEEEANGGKTAPSAALDAAVEAVETGRAEQEGRCRLARSASLSTTPVAERLGHGEAALTGEALAAASVALILNL